ncbi:MAG: hypothetical protein KDK76_04155 [Chlamydiia bacterium]|nr:hypothetical protein [Chlamydiia bacterium]
MIKNIFGAFIAAAIAFAWSFISWAVLPWHDYSMNKFSNQEFVSWVIKENAPKSGVYVAPYYKPSDDLSPDEVIHSIEAQKEAMVKGPFVYTQVRLKGMDPTSPYPYIYSFLTQFIGAFFICLLLKRASDIGYGGRLFFVTLVGLVVGVLGFVPDWTWFGAGWKFTLIMIADIAATWFLAGLFLAAFIKPRSATYFAA